MENQIVFLDEAKFDAIDRLKSEEGKKIFLYVKNPFCVVQRSIELKFRFS